MKYAVAVTVAAVAVLVVLYWLYMSLMIALAEALLRVVGLAFLGA